MPYIPETERKIVEEVGPQSVGQLNYAITKLVIEWLGPCPDYFKFNAAVGVLECAKQELYRRRVAPYEDVQLDNNGDV